MTFDYDRVHESKRAMRQKLASMPIGDKLRILDMMRERTLVIRASRRLEQEPECDEQETGVG